MKTFILIGVVLFFLCISVFIISAGVTIVLGPEVNITATANINSTVNIFVGNASFGNPFDQSLNTTDDVQFQLTTVGSLIVNGLTTSQNITPYTDSLYSLGNSTNWFQELWADTIYAGNINASLLNATGIYANDIATTNITAVDVNTTNLTVAGYEIKEEDNNLVIELT